jgi:pyruvate formate lyase activating enzyme
MKGLVFDIKRYSVNDGPGIRTTIFFKGCPLRCRWCHNPESQETGQETIDVNRPLDGIVRMEKKEVGYYLDTLEVIAEVMKDSIFYEESGGGVTLSGGEPTMQAQFLIEMVKGIKEKGIHVALDTCGFAPWSTFEQLSGLIDLYLYDLKLLDSEAHKLYTGVDNQGILENLNRLLQEGVPIVISIPIIPGINDTEEQMHRLAEYLNALPKPPKTIRLLPYHKTGADKYTRLHKTNPLSGMDNLNARALLPIKTLFESNGFTVNLNG